LDFKTNAIIAEEEKLKDKMYQRGYSPANTPKILKWYF